VIGQQFGRLVVAFRDWQHSSPFRPYAPTWLCLCECGRLVMVPESALVRREREDCGQCGVNGNLRIE